MRRLLRGLLAALGLVRASTFAETVRQLDARLRGLEEDASRCELELTAQREALRELESRVALVDRRAA